MNETGGFQLRGDWVEM